MRLVPDALTSLLLSGSYEPAIRLEIGDFTFTRDTMGTCSNSKEANPIFTSVEGGRIMRADHEEQVYTGKLDLILNNADRLLNGVDLTGEKVRVYWGGYVTPGDEESAVYMGCAPLRVQTHDNRSGEGMLRSHLSCFSMMDELNHDKATEKFVGETETVKTLLLGVLEATLDPYADYEKFNVVFDSEDALIDTVTPGESFVIEVNETRLQAAARLLNMTRCVLRAGADEEDAYGRRTFHILKPIRAGDDYAAEYDLEVIPFLWKSDIKELVLPNHVVVRTPTDMSPTIIGEAIDIISYNRYKDNKQTEYVAQLVDAAQATDIAGAILSNVQAQRKVGAALTPIHFGQEVYDWTKVDDAREGTTSKGNVGVITRLWDADDGSYYQTFSLGGWLNVKKIDQLGSLGSGDLSKSFLLMPTWCVDGELEVDENISFEKAVPIQKAHGLYAVARLKTAPSGDSVTIDINYNGVTIFTDQSHRIVIVAGAKDGESVNIDVPEYVYGGILSIAVDGIGSGDPGEDLCLTLVCERRS